MNFDKAYDDLRSKSPDGRREKIPEHRRELLQQRREESKERIGNAIAVTQEMIPQDSRLRFPEAVLGSEDVDQAISYLEKLGPVTKKNWQLHLHVRRVGEFAKRLTERLQESDLPETAEFGKLDPRTLQVQGLFHDIGKVAGQFGYLRTEYEGDAILKRSGMEHLAVDTVRLGKRFRPLEKLTPEEKLIMYADLCGGIDPKEPTQIMKYEDRLRYHEKTRTLKDYSEFTGLMPAFASEIHGLLELDQGDKDRYTELYKELDAYFHNLGIDREQIRQEIMREEEESPVRGVIFDVGGVLVPDPDEADIALLQEKLGVTAEEVIAAWKDLIPKLQTGELSVDAFWEEFAVKKLGKEIPPGYKTFFADNLATSLTPDMQSLINRLKTNGNYRLGILTNTVTPAMEKLKPVYGQFETVTCSPDIAATKGDPDPVAYHIAALKMHLPPQACVFIDNIGKYVENAGKAHMKGIHYELHQPIETLKSGLEKKGVIL